MCEYLDKKIPMPLCSTPVSQLWRSKYFYTSEQITEESRETPLRICLDNSGGWIFIPATYSHHNRDVIHTDYHQGICPSRFLLGSAI